MMPPDHVVHQVAHLLGVVTDQEVADELARAHGVVVDITQVGTWRRAMGIPGKRRQQPNELDWSPEAVARWSRLYRAHRDGVPLVELKRQHKHSLRILHAAFARLQEEGRV